MDFQKFYNGKEFKAYDFLGAHLLPGGGVVFRTFALNAMKVALIGEFNNWTEAPMSDANRKGFFELTVPDNRQRFVRHAVDWRVSRVRLTPLATHGADEFRLFDFEIG